MGKKIYLVRHGITGANLGNRFAGRSAEPLHSLGVEQMNQLGDQLQEAGIQKIIAGPLVRTIQSADRIGDILAVPVEVDESFNDILIAHWDGLNKESIKKRFGSEYPDWVNRPSEFNLPDCENLNDVQKRAVHSIERLFATDGDNCFLIVSHLIVLRCIVLYYKGMEMQEFRSIKIANGDIVSLIRKVPGKTLVRFEK